MFLPPFQELSDQLNIHYVDESNTPFVSDTFGEPLRELRQSWVFIVELKLYNVVLIGCMDVFGGMGAHPARQIVLI